MADVSINDVKEKYQTLQGVVQSYKEEKIGLESQMATLQSQYSTELQNVLNATGAETLEDAIEICKNKQSELETLKQSLNTDLDKYLDTVEDNGTSSSDGGAMLSEDILGGLL